MRVMTGPLSLNGLEWALTEGTVTGFESDGPDGRADVLVAQILCGAAVSGVKTLMLLPTQRQDDAVWDLMIQMLSGGDRKEAARAIIHLPLRMHTVGTGKDQVGQAELVYAPGLTVRETVRLRSLTKAPLITVGGTGVDDVIRVSGDVLTIDSKGISMPVLYDPSGPMYRTA